MLVYNNFFLFHFCLLLFTCSLSFSLVMIVQFHGSFIRITILIIAILLSSLYSFQLPWKINSFGHNLRYFHATMKGEHQKVIQPEFSRIINVAQISSERDIHCRLLANSEECKGLAKRFELPEITHFSANVTLSKPNTNSILVSGKYEAHISYGEHLGSIHICNNFETKVLHNMGGMNGVHVSFEEATDFDDEVEENGNLDIGEISAQYLSFEL